MSVFKLSDEEYRRCFDNVLRDLPDINWDVVTMGHYWKNNKFITVDIDPSLEFPGFMDIKATFSPDNYILKTKRPILADAEILTHQLVSFGITDISEFRWR